MFAISVSKIRQIIVLTVVSSRSSRKYDIHTSAVHCSCSEPCLSIREIYSVRFYYIQTGTCALGRFAAIPDIFCRRSQFRLCQPITSGLVHNHIALSSSTPKRWALWTNFEDLMQFLANCIAFGRTAFPQVSIHKLGGRIFKLEYSPLFFRP